MFDFLFKYPAAVYQKASFVMLSGWPVWLLATLILVSGAALGWWYWTNRRTASERLRGVRGIAIWFFQWASIALLLTLLWQPALSVSALKPQQNVVSVLVDASKSMAIVEDGKTRAARAAETLNSGLLDDLRKRFQVRVYAIGENGLTKVDKPEEIQASRPATRLGEALKAAVSEAATLPVGAIVLLSDGADNAGGIDQETTAEIRRYRIPVHTIGFGREQMRTDVEITDVQVPARTLADSKLSALVTYRHAGFAGKKAKLTVRDGGKVLATRDITFKEDRGSGTESIVFSAGVAGAKVLKVSVDPVEGEENRDNNAITRLVNVEDRKARILYMEGEPRWEMKFIRRALEEDRTLDLVSILRTTQNKIYRQGIANPKEHEDGFPATVDELFGYQGLIIGTVEVGYFTPAQRELIKQFVDRRGGGVLFLGGRQSFTEGGWHKSELAEILPVSLVDRKGTFHREPATVELTPQGRDSLITRLVESPDQNLTRWKGMPTLVDYQETGAPKPGAVVLAEFSPTSKGKHPFLVMQNYGRGRVAMLNGSTWRWQMGQDSKDQTHEMFWQQLVRWMVNDVYGRVTVNTPKQVYSDEQKVQIRSEIRDTTYQPLTEATVEAKILGPAGIVDAVTLQPDPLTPGVFTGEWVAEKPGSYLAEVIGKRGTEDVGRDVVTFHREDGVAENFRAEQNRELLDKISSQTGGRYFPAAEASKLQKEIAYSEAGITVRETRDLWDMPAFFLLLVLLRSAEWLLRRKWGVV